MEKEIEDDKSDTDNNSLGCDGISRNGKLELGIGMKEKLADLPEVLEFIVRLQTYIEKQRRKLQKLRRWKHNKQKVKNKEASTQTECITDDTKTTPKTISEEITEAAEQALQGTGFVYEETSGMYYDYNSGYYYNAEYGLYYDGNSGTYLKYNQDTKSYEFHSQVSLPAVKADQNEKEIKKRSKRKAEKQQEVSHAGKRERKSTDVELEEGECSDCSVKEEDERDGQSSQDDDESNSDIDYAKQYPPCMRIIVEESNVASLKQGSLHLITFEGGTIGREGKHSLLIPDINISKHHLSIGFDKDSCEYKIVDLGSRNGTHLNGKRLSPSKVESDPATIQHGSRIQIGGVTLLCHVHAGSQTCGHCEPGLLMSKSGDKSEIITTSKAHEHKEQLKHLKKKFGISKNDQGKTEPGQGYTDRAQVRRQTIGSQNPHEKTKAASLTESIESDNKGFKMLSKMGWKEGQSLGKDNQGILEPVGLVSNPGNLGIGNSAEVAEIVGASSVATKDKFKKQVWSKTQERFNKIPEQVTDIFEDS